MNVSQAVFIIFFFKIFWCRPFFKSLLNLLQYWFCLMFWIFGPGLCGIQAPQPGMNMYLLHWKVEVLTHRLPGESLDSLGYAHYYCLFFLLIWKKNWTFYHGLSNYDGAWQEACWKVKSAFGLVTSTPSSQGRRGQHKLSEGSPHGSGERCNPPPPAPTKEIRLLAPRVYVPGKGQWQWCVNKGNRGFRSWNVLWRKL